MVSEVVVAPGEYYMRQSRITDPGEHRSLFAELPEDVPSLCAIVQGLLLHYCEGELYEIEIQEDRKGEIDTRDVSSMLRRIQELDDRPLAFERPPDRRLVGCCRDFATLLCAMLRHRDVPARVRFGFSTYFQPSFYCDHVVCEYWNGEEQRWALVDPQMDGPHRRLNRLTFDPHDVPHDRLIPAGRAWQLCRTGQEDPDCFGVDSSTRGLWFIQSYLVHDVAALNRMELLCWDCWALADSRPDKESSLEELALLDRVAALTLAGDAAFPELRDLYESEACLRVPRVFASYSPNGNRRVDLLELASL